MGKWYWSKRRCPKCGQLCEIRRRKTIKFLVRCPDLQCGWKEYSKSSLGLPNVPIPGDSKKRGLKS